MAEHEQKQCPRCLDSFECKTGSITLCQCHSVALTDDHHEYIHSQYNDCLCSSCLTELRRKFNLEIYESKISALVMR